MRVFRFDKIVRNGIPASIEASGGSAEKRSVADEEGFKLLLDKAQEEIAEAGRASLATRAEELADARAAFEAAITLSGVTLEEIDAAAKIKSEAYGGFIPPVYLGLVALQDDDPWADKLAANPERYEEVPEVEE